MTKRVRSDGWSVDTPPPPIKRAGRVADPDSIKVIEQAIDSGEWLSRTYDDAATAELAARRIRYHAARCNPPVAVETRKTTVGTKVKLSIKVRGAEHG